MQFKSYKGSQPSRFILQVTEIKNDKGLKLTQLVRNDFCNRVKTIFSIKKKNSLRETRKCKNNPMKPLWQTKQNERTTPASTEILETVKYEKWKI